MHDLNNIQGTAWDWFAKLCTAKHIGWARGCRRCNLPVDLASLDRAANRRREAAEWVQQLTGQAVDYASDAAFRRALRDGTLLCQILQHLKPGVIPQVSPCWTHQPCVECLDSLRPGRRRLLVNAVIQHLSPTITDVHIWRADRARQDPGSAAGAKPGMRTRLRARNAHAAGAHRMQRCIHASEDSVLLDFGRSAMRIIFFFMVTAAR